MIAVGGFYALLATVVAIYGLFFKSGDKLETGHPLSNLPDNFGEFEPATRKKVTMYRFNVDGDLPPDQRTGLGGKGHGRADGRSTAARREAPFGDRHRTGEGRSHHKNRHQPHSSSRFG